MVLDNLKEKAKQIAGFEQLPVTAQISLLYSEIETARKLSIPLSAIHAALAEAGSNVSIRYLRQALSVVRARLKGSALEASAATKQTGATVPLVSKPAMPASEPTGITPKEAREKKAGDYVGSASNNPLLRQHQKGKD